MVYALPVTGQRVNEALRQPRELLHGRGGAGGVRRLVAGSGPGGGGGGRRRGGRGVGGRKMPK